MSADVLMPLNASWVMNHDGMVLDLFPILVEQSQDVNVLTEIYTEWADVQTTHLSDADGAVETLRKLFELIPDNVEQWRFSMNYIGV